MEPEIIFLGTAGDVILAGKQERASGGIILKTAGLQFHIDPGPGALTMAKALNVNIRENVAVFVTSSNWIQSNDVNAVILAMTYEGMDKTGVLITNKTSFNGIRNKDPIITKQTKRLVEKAICFESEAKIGINDVEVNTLYARHGKERPIGLKFKTPEFILSYTGVSELNNLVMEAHKGSKIIIINCKNPIGIEERGYMNSEDVIELLKKVKPKLAIITGFGIKMIQSDPLYEAREIQRASKVQVIAARDGLSINPVSYSATLRQKTLSLYK